MPSALFAGPYELLNRLSAGGMGEIFVAKRTGQGAFEKHVALKLLLPHLVSDTEFIERFFDEARLVARMNHPNIVQLFDVGEADGRPFLAMALIEGLSLSSLIKAARAKKEQLPVPVVRLIAVSLLDALSYAHGLVGPKGEKLDVIHRDVTPSNVLISTAGSVLLTDFGIARASTNVYRTQPGRVRGKFAYMAPEHAAERKLDQRADLFSAAVTLYEALTLVSPFARQGDIATMEAVVNGEVAHPRTLRGDAPPGLSEALLKALAKSPDDRFPSARAMRAAVMDGPVASAPELAELFTRLCGDELRERFGGGASPTELPGTLSVPSPGPSRTRAAQAAVGAASTAVAADLPGTDPTPERRRRWWPVLLGAGAFLGTVTALGAILVFGPDTAPAEHPVIEPAPKLAAEVDVPPAPEPAAEPVPEVPPEPVREDPAIRAFASVALDAGSPGRSGPARPTRAPRGPVATAVPPPPLGPAPQVKFGYLSADADPWADVLIDGRRLERTPLSRYPVTVGPHTLVFRAADGRQQTRKIKVEEGQLVSESASF